MRIRKNMKKNHSLTRGGRYRCVRAHEVEFARVVVVTGHEEVALVLVSGRVGGRRLRGRRQPLEVELVGVPLAMHFGHYVLIVVVSETQERLIIQWATSILDAHSLIIYTLCNQEGRKWFSSGARK